MYSSWAENCIAHSHIKDHKLEKIKVEGHTNAQRITMDFVKQDIP